MGMENRVTRLTFRATEAKIGQANFGEQLLLYGDDDMLIFSSVRQLNLLNNCTRIICDGTFEYAPRGTKQIYRVFGLIRSTHATPLVTTLLKKKSKDIYKKMWQKNKKGLSGLALMNSIRFANFDAGVAAYSSFEQVFSGVSVKLCCFHVKQGIYRKLGLSVEYQANGQLQTVVRMLGALQITPILEWAPCIQILRTRISDADFMQDMKEKLEELLIYFQNTWPSLGKIFCLFAYSGSRTTNHAESYHSKQRFHFSMNSKLGHWVMVFKQLTYTEEMDAVDVFEGRQPPRRQRTDYAEITQSLAEEKDKLLQFLSSDDGMFRGEPYVHKLSKYLKRVGRLMGINALDYREILAQDEVVANQPPDEDPNQLKEELLPKKIQLILTCLIEFYPSLMLVLCVSR